MKRADCNRLRRCKRKLEKCLAPKNWDEQVEPMFRLANRVHEMSGHVLIHTRRGLVHRLLTYNDHLKALFQTFTLLKKKVFT